MASLTGLSASGTKRGSFSHFEIKVRIDRIPPRHLRNRHTRRCHLSANLALLFVRPKTASSRLLMECPMVSTIDGGHLAASNVTR